MIKSFKQSNSYIGNTLFTFVKINRQSKIWYGEILACLSMISYLITVDSEEQTELTKFSVFGKSNIALLCSIFIKYCKVGAKSKK